MRLLAEQMIHKLHNRTDAAYGCKEKRNADEIIIKYTDGDKGMLNKKWKRFNKLTGKCYLNMIGTEKDGSCWLQAFELMKEIILEERKSDPQFVSELEMIDDATDYAFDIQGWLEDCLDEIDMREEYETLLKMCNDLLELFGWPEYTGSDIRFRKATVLRELGRTKESVEFCKKWMQKEPGNVVAATSGVYAFISTKEYDAAETLVDRFIINKSECLDENDIMFIAASKLYEAMGKKKEKREIDKAIKKYDEYMEEYIEEYFMNPDFEEDDELPFITGISEPSQR